MSRQYGERLLAAGVLAVASACGGPATPTAPTTSAAITTRVSPSPLTVRRTADGGVFQLSGDISFHNGGGSAIRIVALDVELTDAAGARERQRLPLELEIAAGETVKRPLADSVFARVVREPAHVTIVAQAVDGSGYPLDAEPAATPVVVTTPVPAGALAAPVTFVGAGDIANCALAGAELTARLLDGIIGDVFTLGDHVYPSGTADAFATCYQSTWGRHRSRTRPTPGNHEWEVSGGAPYFAYFGGAAGGGFYSFNLGGWHILSLNSNVNAEPGSPQYEWTRADLAANPSRCTLAYWHHPVFSSGPNGNNDRMRSIWRLLDGSDADLVMAGHDHLYERFAPQDADGRPTPSGLRSFVVGTGGASPYGAAAVQTNSEVRLEQVWGVLKLTLRADAYEWEFVPAAGQAGRDTGSAACVR